MRSATRNKTGKDKAYLAWLHTKPCSIDGCVQRAGSEYFDRGIIEAAHVGPRGLSQKCPDREAIPLCRLHHRTGASSHHTLQKKFWSFHGISRAVIIKELQQRYMKEQV